MGGMPGLAGAMPGMSAAGADAAASNVPALSSFPVPSGLSGMNMPSGNPLAGIMGAGGGQPGSATAMLGLGQQLMQQMQPKPTAPTPSGGSILPPTAPVSMPAGPAGNLPLPLQQLLAKRLGGGIIPQPRIPFDPSMFF